MEDKLDGWVLFRRQILFDLLQPLLIKEGIEYEDIEEHFINKVEDSLNVGFDAICHCLYTSAEDITNKILQD